MEQTPAPARPVDAPLHMVLVTGMSGSGKSVALHALEDAGYRCMDNLPLGLLPALVQLQRDGLYPGDRLAVAVDVRNADALPHVPAQIAHLRGMGVSVRLIFLDASTATLIRRFSETRRRHPLSSAPPDLGAIPHTLVQDIEGERRLLEELRAMAHVIDTSNLRTSQLQGHVKDLLAASGGTQMTLVFQSFGFKSGLPLDSDYVFDVRMLPNPHYEPLLRPLDGRDAPVAQFLREHPQVQQMQRDIQRFLDCWLPRMEKDQRSYVTVAIGCTGGQHRSVFLTETLARHFARRWPTLCRHRALDDGKDVKLPPGPPHS